MRVLVRAKIPMFKNHHFEILVLAVMFMASLAFILHASHDNIDKEILGFGKEAALLIMASLFTLIKGSTGSGGSGPDSPSTPDNKTTNWKTL